MPLLFLVKILNFAIEENEIMKATTSDHILNIMYDNNPLYRIL